MAKLNKRQIIIIIAAVLAASYGLYEFMSGGISSKATKTNKSDSGGKNIVMDSLTSDLIKDRLSGVDVYVISRAEADWQKNPFWERNSYREWANKDKSDVKISEAAPVAKIVYSGYVEAGNKKMAVINGVEYSVGDKLEVGGYVLKKITATKVILNDKNEKIEKEIPIQE